MERLAPWAVVAGAVRPLPVLLFRTVVGSRVRPYVAVAEPSGERKEDECEFGVHFRFLRVAWLGAPAFKPYLRRSERVGVPRHR